MVLGFGSVYRQYETKFAAVYQPKLAISQKTDYISNCIFVLTLGLRFAHTPKLGYCMDGDQY